MSCEDSVPLGSQIKVSLGGKTELCVTPARHCGIGAMATGLATPCPDEPISPDSRAVAHLAGSKSPPRPPIAKGPWLKVSQNAGALKLQFADGTNTGVGVTGVGGAGVGGGDDGGGVTDANLVQLAVEPPLEPPQLHVHGPEPATADDVPIEQRLAEGADDALVPFADPQAPLTATGAAVTTTVVLAAADLPPIPVQVSV